MTSSGSPGSSLIGHADDCAACQWHQLPSEDRAVLDEAAFTRHARRERPEPPPGKPVPGTVMLLTCLGIFVGGLVTVSVPVMLFSVLALVASSAVIYRVEQGWRDQVEQRYVELDDWKTEQAQAWLQRRAEADLWPCPTCDSLTCPNQHTVTTTKTVRVGRFYSSRSHTDPV